MQLGGSLKETFIVPSAVLCMGEFPPPQLTAMPIIKKIAAPHKRSGTFRLIQTAEDVLTSVPPADELSAKYAAKSSSSLGTS